ncbi:hypothetical protein V6N11_037872 [Hibiscus sabdariffa]|uniref:Uncharacterized protein n=2 Tax=Hibiscus sabdariffa TaxID=183260 RepID=A0ABR2A6V9_9ROSI
MLCNIIFKIRVVEVGFSDTLDIPKREVKTNEGGSPEQAFSVSQVESSSEANQSWQPEVEVGSKLQKGDEELNATFIGKMHNDDSYTIEVETNRHIGECAIKGCGTKEVSGKCVVSPGNSKYVSRKIKGQDSKLIEGVSWVDMVCKGLKDGIGPIDVVNDDKKDKLIGFTDDGENGLCGELNAMSFWVSEDMHCMGLYTLDELRGSTKPVKSIKKKSA